MTGNDLAIVLIFLGVSASFWVANWLVDWSSQWDTCAPAPPLPAAPDAAFCAAAFVREMVTRARAIGHWTVWGHEPTALCHHGQGRPLFFFVTFDAAHAARARQTLAAAGLLCDTDLGWPSSEDRIAWASATTNISPPVVAIPPPAALHQPGASANGPPPSAGPGDRDAGGETSSPRTP